MSSPPLTTVTEALPTNFRIGLPWKLPYANGLVLIADSLENSKKFKRSRGNMEPRSLRIHISKPVVMISSVDKS